MSRAELDETAVENFREYLRIPSVQPDVNYGERLRGSAGIRDLVEFRKTELNTAVGEGKKRA